VLELAGLAAVMRVNVSNVSKDAMPQKGQGEFVTALLLASSSFLFAAASSFLDAASLILASSASFFFFNAAASLQAVLWTALCSAWQAREQQ
jgi:hypothetical protein